MLHLQQERIERCQFDSSDPMTASVPRVGGFALQLVESKSSYCEIWSRRCPGANARRLSLNGLRKGNVEKLLKRKIVIDLPRDRSRFLNLRMRRQQQQIIFWKYTRNLDERGEKNRI